MVRGTEFMRWMLPLTAAILVGCSSPAPQGQESKPDRHGEVVSTAPALPSAGVRADAPVPPSDHQKNTGGTDGAGLCVYASAVTAMRWLELRQQAEALWAHAKSNRGGSYPEKFGRDMAQVNPLVKFAQYEGNDYNVLVRLTQKRLAVPVTMGTGGLYNYRTIAHMVTGIHFDDRWACIVDNNDPGKYYWMPKDEFIRRWVKPAGQGWAIAFEPTKWLSPSLTPSAWASIVLLVCAAIKRRMNEGVEQVGKLAEVAL